MTAVYTDPTDAGNRPGDGPLRVGGRSTAALPLGLRDVDLPNRESSAYKRQMPALTIARDLWEGTAKVRDRTTAYLPMAPGEKGVDYRSRLLRSVFLNVFRNTIEGLTGFVFREDPELGEDVPPAIAEAWENIDQAGTHGDVFLRDLMTDAMTAGHAAILVEYPKTEGQQTAADEAAGIRPYWIHVRKENILSWRVANEAGRLVLTQVVLRECTSVPDGMFGDREQTRYRVLYREGGVVGYRLLEILNEASGQSVREVDAGLYRNQEEIPLAEVRTAGSTGLFESQPPFLDLAYLNVAHYQQWSDYATSIHMTCVPFLFTAGVHLLDEQGNQITVGPNSAIASSDPQAKAMYVSHDGAALGTCKGALDDLKTDMAMLGLAALQSSKRVAETATAKELDQAASDAALAVTARGVQDGVERALAFHARYLGLDDGGSVGLSRDYSEPVMDAATMTAYATLAEKLGLPYRVILEALQEGRRLPETADLDELETQMVAERAASETRRLEDQATRMQALQGQPGQPVPVA